MRSLIFPLILFCLAACASPHVQTPSDVTQKPELTPAFVVMEDGYKLPVTTWQPAGDPQAVILGLHGFNDYRNAFTDPAVFFATSNIMTIAYDQRGFGDTSQRGIWPGNGTLEADAWNVTRMLCEQHPDLPLYLMGESMGGAVVMSMIRDSPCIKGVILIAPAVWGWQAMPWWQQFTLNISAHVAPGKKLTGDGLDITPSDNVEMLRALGRDPLVIKETRIDAMYGLTDLMESALLASSGLATPALILYGANDEIIPSHPTCMMMDRLPDPDTAAWRFVLYPDGYHMLTRDLQAETVLRDIVSWIHNQSASLPSALEVNTDASRVRMLCSDAQELPNTP
jgi:acylglycerol lipase